MGAAYREELSANARKLIEQLLSLPQGWVTAATLAESIGGQPPHRTAGAACRGAVDAGRWGAFCAQPRQRSAAG